MPSLTVPAINLIEAQQRVLERHGLVMVREELDHRTMSGKRMLLQDGQYHVSTRIGPVHYQADPEAPKGRGWSEINLTPIRTAGGWRVDRTFYDLEVTEGRPGFQYRSKRGALTTVELESVDGREPDMSAMRVRVVDNQVLWDDVDTDLDMKLLIRPGYAEMFKQLRSPNAARRFRWRVTEEDDDDERRPARFVRKTAGTERREPGERNEGRLEIANRVLGERRRGGRREFTLEEEWTGRVSRVADLATRRRQWFEDARYPLIVDASVQENIVSGADDVLEIAAFSFFDSTNSKVQWGTYGPNDLDAGVRFQSLGVPPGATIDAAILTFNVLDISGAPSARIYGDDVDDAPPWSAGDGPAGITKTSAYVVHAPASTGTGKTADVQAVVAAIIARGGWVENADIRFGIHNAGTSGLLNFEAYEHAGTDEAQLDVTYTVGPPEVAMAGSLPAMSGRVFESKMPVRGDLPAQNGALAAVQAQFIDLAGDLPAQSGRVYVSGWPVEGNLPAMNGAIDEVFAKKFIAGSLPAMSGEIVALQFVDLAGELPAQSGALTKVFEKDLAGVLPAQSGSLRALPLQVRLSGLLVPMEGDLRGLPLQVRLSGSLPAMSGALLEEFKTRLWPPLQPGSARYNSVKPGVGVFHRLPPGSAR